MKKQDELDLWELVKEESPYEVIAWLPLFEKLGIPEGRGYYILEKWCDKNIIEYGCSVRFCWFTRNGKENWKLWNEGKPVLDVWNQ